MIYTRREVLRSGLLGAGSMWLRPGLLASAPRTGSCRGGDSVLIVLQLSGGNDGLNTLVPFEHDVYRKARPTLALPADQCLKIADGLGFHPALKGLRALLDSGDLAIVQGVGYPRPNRSHFKSMDIWHSADPSDQTKRDGWLARLCNLCNTGGEDVDPAAAAQWSVNLAARTPLALQGGDSQPISFTDPERFRFQGSEAEQKAFTRMTEAERAESGEQEILDLLGRTATNARTHSDAIRQAVADYRTDVEYPAGRLGGSLRTVAALLQSDLQTRVFYVYQGGYDTHAGQAARHQRLLQELDAALTAFQNDLRRTGDDDRVTLMAFSEFGRRVVENGSGGTDHGAAGPLFLLGRHVRGGLHGTHPDLTELQRGDPVFTTDFRSVYQAVLADWMRVDSKAVLGARFPRLELFPV